MIFNLYQGSENLVLESKMVRGLVCRLIFKALNLNLSFVVVSCHQKVSNPWNLHISPPAPLPLMVRATVVVVIQVDWPFKTDDPAPYYWDTRWSVV